MSGKPGDETTRRPSSHPTSAVAGLLSLIAIGGLAARALTGGDGRRRQPQGTPGAAVTPTRVTAGHETSDLPPGPVSLAIAGLLSLVVVGALVAWALTATFERRRPAETPSAFERAAASPAAPRLEVKGRADRRAIEDRAAARLTGYGWTDREAGLAHIPIERAMSLQAQAGWPDNDAGPVNAGTPGRGEGAP